MRLKYQKELDFFIENGYQLPKLFLPSSKEAYRYVFSKDIQNNHIPPHKLHPSRLKQQIKDGNVDLSGYALSNFETLNQAVTFYRYLRKSCKNVKKQIGDSLSFGVLKSKDGMITFSDSSGLFDLYESEVCDLNTTFNIIKAL